jgi:hypothetical protein
LEVKYWHDIFEEFHKLGQPNTWDYPWTFTCWQNSGLTVLPNVNLVSNIGFRSDGTHVTGESKFANMPVKDIGEIRHPSFLMRDRTADEYTFDHHFGGKSMKMSTSLYTKFRKGLSTVKRYINTLIK